MTNEYCYQVMVQAADEPFTRVVPDTVICNTIAETAVAVARALALLPDAAVVVTREQRDDDPDDPDLNDWPAARHVRKEA